jgi:hypothetical protein
MIGRTTLYTLVAGASLFAGSAIAGPTILDGNEHSARTSAADTIFYDQEFPTLHIRNVGGNAVIVEGDEVEDVISYASSITVVVATIEPPSGNSITVTTLSGPTWYEDVSSGVWEAEFTVPNPGNEVSGTFEVAIDGSQGLSNNGNFKIKKQSGG